MNHLSELKREIEIVRKELDVAVQGDEWAPECYQVSVRLDALIEDYMQYEEKIRLLSYS
ncbi:hypothetical protein C805_02138 [Eubacterium sp. 14-2]|uniref:aspartyl-phosphate phosphatase Spo0E family protein n=1 Tax=Eubacterium sp. 14-2 TaxID=1235790 RepID=UPI0003359F64|nr:aspartyl-phosphate phosphatase Spo0E family protein [Eubacterium sp. 14-2]EOT25509.1 hypothetical protein C805_02138 [Eubacterium sp. 14-2]